MVADVAQQAAAEGTDPQVVAQLPQSPDVDRRLPREFLDDARAAGNDVAIPICSSIVELVQPGGIMPVSGLPNTETLLGNELGFFATFRSDRHGFNNPDEIYSSESNGHRIVLIGDSHTQGFTVEPADNIAGQLRARGLSVYNLGCGGNGPLAELAAYVEYGRFLRPDTVVLIYYEGNDLYDLSREWSSVLRNYIDATFSQNLIEQEDERLRVLQGVAGTPPESRSTGLVYRLLTLRHIRNRLAAVVSQRKFDTEVAQFREVITALQLRVREQAAELMVVYLPHGSTMANGRRNDCSVFPAHCKSAVLSVLDGIDVPVVDFEDTLNALENPYSVFPYHRGNEVLGHLNQAGYALVASSIARALTDQGKVAATNNSLANDAPTKLTE